MRQRKGFTLIDLLLAITLLGVIMTTVYMVFANHQKIVLAAAEDRDTFAQGRMILDRITRDLSGVWLPNKERNNENAVYKFMGTGESVNFLSTARLAMDISSGRDLVEIGYYLERNMGSEGYSLKRRQDETPDDEGDRGGWEIVLSSEVKEFELFYLLPDGLEGSIAESETSSSLPRAVRVKLVIKPDNERPERAFTTLVALPLAWPKVKKITLPQGLESLFE